MATWQFGKDRMQRKGLTGQSPAPDGEKPDFKEYLLGGPKTDDLPIDRDRDTGRGSEPVSGES